MRRDLIKHLREVEPHRANEFVLVTGIRMMIFPSGSWLNTPASPASILFNPPWSPADWSILIRPAVTGCCYRGFDFRLCR
jgi:hypothetical protein